MSIESCTLQVINTKGTRALESHLFTLYPIAVWKCTGSLCLTAIIFLQQCLGNSQRDFFYICYFCTSLFIYYTLDKNYQLPRQNFEDAASLSYQENTREWNIEKIWYFNIWDLQVWERVHSDQTLFRLIGHCRFKFYTCANRLKCQ